MSHPDEKGTKVNSIEHPAMTPSPETGRRAILVSGLRAAGRSSFSVALLALAIFVPVAALASAPASASTNCRPDFGGSASSGGAASPVKSSLTSVVLAGVIRAVEGQGCEVGWKIEWATAPGGPWNLFPGGSGIVILPESEQAAFETGELTGLEPETTYYTRGVLTLNSVVVKEASGNFNTRPLRPFAVGAEASPASIGETSGHVQGTISPSPFETHWRIEYSTSRSTLESGGGTLLTQGTISQAEAEALQGTVGAGSIHPEANLTGLSANTSYYIRAVAEDEPEWPPSSGEFHRKTISSATTQFETHGPPVAEASSTPALHRETIRVLGYVVPHGFDTHYRFQYVSQEHFEHEGFANPFQSAEEDAGSGGSSGVEATAAAADLPGLSPGQAYRYRIVATSPAAGGVTVPGAGHALTVPVPAEAQAPQPCENEALRSGASARLPDCRAYEQVTPAEKGGAQQAFSYSNQIEGGALVGEDGDHLAFEQPFVHWGSGQSPYFFSRSASGWEMTPGRAQPEAGIDTYTPQLFNPDLTRFAFAAGWKTGVQESSNLEFKAGIPGGPYPAAASVPRAQAELNHGSLGWVAASDDFSKLIFATTDRTLAGPTTTTTTGADLYEFAEGALHQLNVTTVGATIGECGASVVRGTAEAGGSSGAPGAMPSSRHTVSVDGSRIFFDAVPSANCSEPPHLYMRTDGGTPAAQTVDIGAYRFLAANPSGTEVLLEAPGAETQQVLLYDTATATAEPLLTLHEHENGSEHPNLTISEDFSTLYLLSRVQLTPDAPPPTGGEHAGNSADLYRFEVATKAMHLVAQLAGARGEFRVTSDGRYATWIGELSGFPQRSLRAAYLYDGARNLVECVSCASPFEPEPEAEVAPSYFEDSGVLETRNGSTQVSLLAAGGRRLFFDTRATLLPSDIDGESSPQLLSHFWSPSSDVYEWRANGLEGCTGVQGCLALVSSGRGGYLVQLLGTDPSGRDVFFTTQEQLTPNTDTDNSMDIYDARSGGGFPPQPPGPVECEGDACAHPLPAPNDPTPGTATVNGAGNVHPIGKRHHKKHKRSHRKHKRVNANRGGAR